MTTRIEDMDFVCLHCGENLGKPGENPDHICEEAIINEIEYEKYCLSEAANGDQFYIDVVRDRAKLWADIHAELDRQGIVP